MAELWEWAYEGMQDKYGVAVVRMPEETQIATYVYKGYRVHLIRPDGTVLKGRVLEHNRHYARVQVDRE
jgi:hypothetical protein